MRFVNLKNIAIFCISVVFLSLALSIFIDSDPELYKGQPVVIIIGNERVPGHIYNIRGDGRYTIRYINNRGEPVTNTFKRFEFEIVE